MAEDTRDLPYEHETCPYKDRWGLCDSISSAFPYIEGEGAYGEMCNIPMEILTEIKVEPFDWNDNMSQIALEDFSTIQQGLPYCPAQSIGMALAKLELLEKQGCRVEENADGNNQRRSIKNN